MRRLLFAVVLGACAHTTTTEPVPPVSLAANDEVADLATVEDVQALDGVAEDGAAPPGEAQPGSP